MIPYSRQVASELKGSLLKFTKVFFKEITGRDFVVANCLGREAPQVIICRELTALLRNPPKRFGLGIHVAPGSGKSTLCCMAIAWFYAHYPDSNFLYVSYSKDLATKHTAFIKHIMSSDLYKHLFDVHIRHDSRAKEHFMTTAGGETYALGSDGSVTGKNAGLPDLERFSGLMMMDDTLKPDAANSDTQRQSNVKNYFETLAQRTRGERVPVVYVGQRLHEEDLAHYLYSGQDARQWKEVKLKSLDEAGNALYPEIHSKEYLLELQDKQPYVFSSQFQQEPIPAGGALYKKDDFVILDEEPEMLATFIISDTAETDKSYNDATVFSFFGIYEIENFGKKTGDYGLHWIDCLETRVEPKDLENVFLDFYTECNRHRCQPKITAIEKKSTGTFLLSLLHDLRGMQVRDIKRDRSSGSKTTRFLKAQPYIASKLISLTKNARHVDMCINHMTKITANESHRFDDIADTLVDGITLALVDKTIYTKLVDDETDDILDNMNKAFKIRQGAFNNARSGRDL